MRILCLASGICPLGAVRHFCHAACTQCGQGTQKAKKYHLRQIIALNSIHRRNHASIVCLRVKSDRLADLASPRQKLRKPRSPSKSPTFTFIKLSPSTNKPCERPLTFTLALTLTQGQSATQ